MSLAKNTTTGEKSGFAVGGMWGGGVNLETAVTADEALKLSGLDYHVEKVPMFAQIGEDEAKQMPTRFATMRTDTKDLLGVVSDKYQVVQNVDAFSFFDSLVDLDDSDKAIFHTAGAIGQGEKMWIQAKMPAHIKVGKDDITDMYVTIMNGHDKTTAVNAYMTPIRVFCDNTLRASLRQAKDKITISHLGDVKKKLEIAAITMGMSNAYAIEMNEALNFMHSKKINKKQINEFLDFVIPFNVEIDDKTKKQNERLNKKRELLLETTESGVGQDVNRDSRYWLYNGYTRFLEDNYSRDAYANLTGSMHKQRNDAFQFLMN